MEIKFTVDASGDIVVLTNYGHLLDGRRGDLAPLTTLETQRVGGVLRKSIYRQEKRPLDLPFIFMADTPYLLQDNVRTVLDVLSQGEGTLTWTQDNDIVRELRNVFYKAGMGEKNWKQAMETVLAFDALDPYWYDPTEVEEEFASGGDPPTSLFFPVPPLYLMPSAILEEKVVSNPGAENWPVWTITGPGDTLSFINNTTGRRLIYSGSLLVSDTLVIDTRPLQKTVRLNGVNAWEYIPKDSADLWSLAAGDNDILVSVANSTSETLVQLAYYPRYISL